MCGGCRIKTLEADLPSILEQLRSAPSAPQIHFDLAQFAIECLRQTMNRLNDSANSISEAKQFRRHINGILDLY
ncbi:hypothetical protein BHS09_09045 [Myxococcus xanthus]|uniref:Uncharacterized protein n=1 Tax=Myxococcus xanthus TaxID=34 RepID=A0AAE6KRC5_MYXXA|nr:hypothetical protein BHS09_09045 [Myxococcus xanthus]QDE74407.1 hypothetical protein BHS08_09055 [Myxococcus xanthus]